MCPATRRELVLASAGLSLLGVTGCIGDEADSEAPDGIEVNTLVETGDTIQETSATSEIRSLRILTSTLSIRVGDHSAVVRTGFS